MPDSRPSSSPCPDLADLLLASEGELSRRRQAEVTAHLRACAACREQLGNVGMALREYQDALPSHVDADVRAERLDIFRGRVQAERADASRGLRLPFRQWLPVAAAVPVLVAVLVFSNRATSVVRAEELLTRAAAAQDQPLPPNIVRRLEYNISPRAKKRVSFTREVTSSPTKLGTPVSAEPESLESATATELQRLLDQSHFDWHDPLSVSGFRAWRNSLASKTDSVSVIDGETLALRTVTTEGVLRSAELIVRRIDFQPVRQTLYFDGFGEVEVVELSRSVRPPAALLAEHTAPAAPAAALEPAAPGPELLDETELDVRLALHGVKADLNPSLAVTRSLRTIDVRGHVDAGSRTEITHALGKVGSVRLLLRPDAQPSAPGSVDLELWLGRTFGRQEHAEAFVNALLTDATLVQQRSAAFAALAARYPEADTRKLNASAQKKLETLAAAQYQDLVKAVEALDDRLALFLGTSTRPVLSQSPLREWQTRATRLVGPAGQLDQALRGVLHEHDLPLPSEVSLGRESTPLSQLRQASDAVWAHLQTD